MKWTQKTLGILGLTTTQTKVLGVLNEEKTLAVIARETGISRTGAGYCLEQLRERGLVFRRKQYRQYLYRAMSAEELSEKLESIALELLGGHGRSKRLNLRTSAESEVIVYRGIEEIIPAYERITSSNKNARLRVIQPNKSWMTLHKKLLPDQLIRVNNALRDHNIILEAILQRDAYALYEKFLQNNQSKITDIAESFTGRMADYTLVSPNLFDHHAELWMFRQTGLLINWEDEIALEIVNADMIGFLGDFFDIAKASGSKIDHNRVMREMIERNTAEQKN